MPGVWEDRRNLLSRLTLRRLTNFLRLYVSYFFSRLLRRPLPWGLPMALSVEPTTACNLQCPECPSGLRAFTRPTGNLKEDFFRRIIDELHEDLLYLLFYFQGEPFIHPGFLEMVRYARGKGIYTATSTNGHFLDDATARTTVESGLDRLIISLDGTTQEVYEQYRVGGELEKVLEGTRNILRWKQALRSKTPHVIFQFLVVRPNEHQIGEARALARELGVGEIRFKTAQVYDYRNGNRFIPQENRFSRYQEQEDGTFRIKNPLLNQCWKLWHASVITWNGLVLPCCFDKDASHVLGTMQGSRFREIWKGQAYQGFRQKLLIGRKEIDICTNCTEGCKVWTEPA